MRQFTIHANASASHNVYPYLLNVQSGAVARLPTCVVVPMSSASGLPYKRITRLMPEVEILGGSYVLVTQELAAVARTILGPAVAELTARRSEIVAALDLLFTGL
ncbi:MAG: CcdB family protein [Clostridia bacterium]|nr:CcdB family protein [Deltaproteobacteria bacterium]